MAINQRKIGTILSYVQLLLTTIIGLLYTPFMLQLLSQSEYGLFGTASSLTSYLSLLSFGVTGSYMKFVMEYRVKKDKKGEDNLNGMFLLIYCAFSILVIIVGAAIIFFSDGIFGNSLDNHERYEIKWIMFITILSYVLTFLFTPVMMNIQSHERYLFLRSLNILTNIFTPFVNIIILLFFPYAISLSISSLIIQLITYIIYFWYATRKLNMGFSFKEMKFTKVKAIFIFSGFLLLNDITNQIINSTDRLVLGVVSGTIAVAIYTVGTTFSTYFSSFSSYISSVFSPGINKIVAKAKLEGKSPDPELNEIFIKVGRIQFLILALVVIGFSCVGYNFILLWAGEEYIYSFWIAWLLMLSPLIPLIQNVGLEIQKAKNMHKVRSIIYFFIAIANVIFTIIFASYFSQDCFPKGAGGIAAVIVTFICVQLGQGLFMNIYYHKKIGLDIPKFWKNILRMIPGMMIPLSTGLLLNRFIPANNWYTLLFEVFTILVVYIVSVYFFSMNEYEKNLFLSPIRMLSRKIRK